MSRDRHIFEGPNGTPRPKRDVSPNSRLSATVADRVRGVKLPDLKRWACCGGFCSVSHTASCPVLTPNEPYVLGMLLGIRRELDQWGSWKHRCWTPIDVASCECTCGKLSTIVSPPSLQYALNLRWARLFAHAGFESGRRGYWHARPGTTMTPASELVRVEVGE